MNIYANVAVLCMLTLGLFACQPQPQNAQGTMQQGARASAVPASTAPASQPSSVLANNGTIVGTWGNSQVGMMFQLAPNGAYQMQAQGNQVAGTWAVPQEGIIVFTVNNAPSNYRYSLQNGQLGLQDAQGQVLWFAPVQVTAARQPVATGNTRNVRKGALKYPQRYRGYNAPVLAYFAETLAKQTPQNVAQGLRSLSGVGHQLLASRSAFAEQLHWLGCQADASLVLYNSRASGRNPQNCAATQASWQNTYQLSDGAVTPANCDQCSSEVFSTIIEFRCTAGLMSKRECQAVMQQMQNQINMSHESMTRMIHNMPGSNGCMCGDANCSC